MKSTSPSTPPRESTREKTSLTQRQSVGQPEPRKDAPPTVFVLCETFARVDTELD